MHGSGRPAQPGKGKPRGEVKVAVPHQHVGPKIIVPAGAFQATVAAGPGFSLLAHQLGHAPFDENSLLGARNRQTPD